MGVGEKILYQIGSAKGLAVSGNILGAKKEPENRLFLIHYSL